MKLLGQKRGLFSTIFNFLFGPSESQTVKQLKKIVAILMENQILQQSLLEFHVKALDMKTILLANNRHMINSPVNVLKSINTTVYHIRIQIQILNYAHNFILTLADIDYRINFLHYGL